MLACVHTQICMVLMFLQHFAKNIINELALIILAIDSELLITCSNFETSLHLLNGSKIAMSFENLPQTV